jgi:uncharacterized membrane protein YedE/YeeE
MAGRKLHIVTWLSAGCAGLLFGFGLLLGGMANPEKVLDFFDIAGQWDPSLALVMVGAIAIGLPAYALASFRGRSFLKLPIDKPTRQTLDKRLVLGSAAFGIGWGLAGICPGPAFVLLGAGSAKGMVFFAFMLLGFALFEWFDRSR